MVEEMKRKDQAKKHSSGNGKEIMPKTGGQREDDVAGGIVRENVRDTAKNVKSHNFLEDFLNFEKKNVNKP